MERDAVWKLKTPTMGVCEVKQRFDDYRPTAVTLPAGALLKVLNAPPDSAFVETEWEGKRVLSFRLGPK